MPPFPREGSRSFTKRAANFAEGLFGRFRPKGLTNALKYVETENAKNNTRRRVPKVGFGPGGPIRSLNDKYVSPELEAPPGIEVPPGVEESFRITRNADIREQNRFRRVMALLDEKNFESFFGFSDMNVEQNPKDRHPPRVIIEDYERLLTTGKRYGNNSEESEGEIIEAYNDLVFMILHLLFLVCKYILHDFKIEIFNKIGETQDRAQRARLQILLSKVNESIIKADEVSQYNIRIDAARQKDAVVRVISLIVGFIIMDSAMLGSGIIIEAVGIATSALLYGSGGMSIMVFLLKLTGTDNMYTREVRKKYRLHLIMSIKALHKLLQIVFNSENSIKIVDLKDKNVIDWGIFNHAQLKLILTREPPKIIKKLRDQICPICQECINPKNYYDDPSGQTNEESQTTEEKKKEEECKSPENEVYFDKQAEELLCGHRYHTDCITAWIKGPNQRNGIIPPQHNLCPVCRAPIYRHNQIDYINKTFDSNQGGERMHKVEVRNTADLYVGPDGMTDAQVIHFLSDLLSLYYEPDRFITVRNEATIKALGKTPNKPVPTARPFTHKPKSANNVTRHSITGIENEEGAFNKFRGSDSRFLGFGSNNMNVHSNPALSLRAPEGGKRRTRKYKRLSRK